MAEASRLAVQLAASMKRAKMGRMYAPNNSYIYEVVARGGDTIRCSWRTNHASVSPSANSSIATEFIRAYPTLAMEAARRVEIMKTAEKWSTHLASRMTAAGIRSIPCSKRSYLARVRVGQGGVECTWRTNGVTVRADDNASVAEAFVAELRQLNKTVRRTERGNLLSFTSRWGASLS